MRNLKLLISYDGTDFFGWQTQPGARTVQQTLETTIASITGEERVRLNASGRTDSGVHALGQVANFFTASTLPADKFAKAINAKLDFDVAVHDAVEVPGDFDANRNAIRKHYRYVISDAATPGPFLKRYFCHWKRRLDDARMAAAAATLVGTHDFHSFETEWPNRASSVRTIYRLDVARDGDFITIDAEADGFLYNMVRAIAGTLINVGRGYWPVDEVAAILRAEDRTRAGPTAPAQGLFLVRVTYDGESPAIVTNFHGPFGWER